MILLLKFYFLFLKSPWLYVFYISINVKIKQLNIKNKYLFIKQIL